MLLGLTFEAAADMEESLSVQVLEDYLNQGNDIHASLGFMAGLEA